MNMPTPLKGVCTIAWLQLVLACFVAVILIVAGIFHPQPHSVVAGARAAIFKVLDVGPTTSRVGRSGVALGMIFFYSLFPVMLLRFIRTRNLNGLRITAGAELLLSATHGGLFVIPLFVLVTSFLKSTRRYLERTEEEMFVPKVLESSQWEA